jgi:hypothetical protein
MNLRIRRAHSAAAVGEATAASTIAGRNMTSSPCSHPAFPISAFWFRCHPKRGGLSVQRAAHDIPTRFRPTGRIVSALAVSMVPARTMVVSLIGVGRNRTTQRVATPSGVSLVGTVGDPSVLPAARTNNPHVSFWATAFYAGLDSKACALTFSKRRPFLNAAQHLVHAKAPHLVGCDSQAREGPVGLSSIAATRKFRCA